MTGGKRLGRPATGHVITIKSGPNAGRLQGIIVRADGSKQRLPPFPHGWTKARAKEATLANQEQARAADADAAPTAPAVLEDESPMGRWFAAWRADRVAAGQTTTGNNVAHYRLHIAPSIGRSHIKNWTREDLRKLSRDLDEKVRRADLAWKTAVNVWGSATKMCNDAAESKHDSIRCRTDDPSQGVRGPDKGDEVGLQFLYPSEFLKFVSCEDVPLRWRQLVALAVYSYARDGELRVLEPRDVDEEHGRLSITKSLENKTGRIGSPKGGRSRRVPMEANLAPLVRALARSFPSHRDMARGLRRWLKRAGVDRYELHHTTPITDRSGSRTSGRRGLRGSLSDATRRSRSSRGQGTRTSRRRSATYAWPMSTASASETSSRRCLPHSLLQERTRRF